MATDIAKLELNLNPSVWVNEEKLPGFQKLLESWIRVYQKGCHSLWPEFLWEYTERPQVGLLSNAAVLIDGVALEEWATQKTSGGNTSYGRNDLWLRLYSADYQIEAKHAKLSVHKTIDESEATISYAMEQAQISARELISRNREINVAISFVTLEFDKGNSDTTILDKKITELLQRIKNNYDAVATIWLNTETFQIAREARLEKTKNEPLNEKWRIHDGGLILFANRIN
jgi:hypothetical protein